MKFCTYEKCPHYSKATKYDRACYYGEPQCWKGWLVLMTIGLIFQRRGRGRVGMGEEKSDQGSQLLDSQSEERRQV